MKRAQVEILLNLKGWQPARYGKVWYGAYHDAIGLCYIRLDYVDSKRRINWTGDWNINELPGKGDDILMLSWDHIPRPDLIRIFTEIERHNK